ncbi:hypothetical protein A2630_02590 [Candidatus Woesebacteria bacterium RIFCSPHIGHO2_01_FULL_44_10]|uniref:Uncharacterized protein n=1 Tax=Candidatus Woesebacteria bacterium RIFCSPLOWO2_01_FULL_44_14 TaxID=1802525 RepID=A0A1F8C3S4_9BACT|nr:MAG: hypothetical protein A2630_02590 [Candidatus Woesebacteria bacterium RIFCSPHIGHO2_01_FULL_44_10]OGM56129.1 MAG: hypothetical protein A3F62_00660 [Candidatus Woesebacteria bacterium RIFCSPHIGHO2_12_FULL_44_11]OGM70932.1 MAG: hypothetical protein A2975_01505 [Candidatus Woesebacteria bacterium RIFCSPLOWO2_01_FULL_44_14]
MAERIVKINSPFFETAASGIKSNEDGYFGMSLNEQEANQLLGDVIRSVVESEGLSGYTRLEVSIRDSLVRVTGEAEVRKGIVGGRVVIKDLTFERAGEWGVRLARNPDYDVDAGLLTGIVNKRVGQVFKDLNSAVRKAVGDQLTLRGIGLKGFGIVPEDDKLLVGMEGFPIR